MLEEVNEWFSVIVFIIFNSFALAEEEEAFTCKAMSYQRRPYLLEVVNGRDV